MKALKIILLIIFGLSLFGQFSMLAKGENGGQWAYITIGITGLIIFFLVRSIGREPKKDE